MMISIAPSSTFRVKSDHSPNSSRKWGSDMAFWIELRCDERGKRCFSSQNNGPMMLSGNLAIDATVATRQLKSQARKQGWVQGAKQQTWLCPNCASDLRT
jgi:hypothetical protein